MYDPILSPYSNLFSANHRNGMIQRHGGTQAQVVQVGELEDYYNDTIKPREQRYELPESHDCKRSPDSSCAGCEAIREALNN